MTSRLTGTVEKPWTRGSQVASQPFIVRYRDASNQPSEVGFTHSPDSLSSPTSFFCSGDAVTFELKEIPGDVVVTPTPKEDGKIEYVVAAGPSTYLATAVSLVPQSGRVLSFEDQQGYLTTPNDAEKLMFYKADVTFNSQEGELKVGDVLQFKNAIALSKKAPTFGRGMRIAKDISRTKTNTEYITEGSRESKKYVPLRIRQKMERAAENEDAGQTGRRSRQGSEAGEDGGKNRNRRGSKGGKRASLGGGNRSRSNSTNSLGGGGRSRGNSISKTDTKRGTENQRMAAGPPSDESRGFTFKRTSASKTEAASSPAPDPCQADPASLPPTQETESTPTVDVQTSDIAFEAKQQPHEELPSPDSA
mmetsp:Transcript_39243/g.77163  ORF Transcript_39243/g.77163 Transcript_39243/m.77163 type:complete len:363 (+) Transcript_39243:69-1157(+)